MKHTLFLLIKGVSIVLITGAIGLELWPMLSQLTQSPRPPLPIAVFWVTRFALIAHGVEALVAAVVAIRQQRSPIFAAIYTFFVGTVGLVEQVTADASTIAEASTPHSLETSSS